MVFGAVLFDELLAKREQLSDGDGEQRRRILRPCDPLEADEGHDVLAVSALRVGGLPASDPSFKQPGLIRDSAPARLSELNRFAVSALPG